MLGVNRPAYTDARTASTPLPSPVCPGTSTVQWPHRQVRHRYRAAVWPSLLVTSTYPPFHLQPETLVVASFIQEVFILKLLFTAAGSRFTVLRSATSFFRDQDQAEPLNRLVRPAGTFRLSLVMLHSRLSPSLSPAVPDYGRPSAADPYGPAGGALYTSASSHLLALRRFSCAFGPLRHRTQ